MTTSKPKREAICNRNSLVSPDTSVRGRAYKNLLNLPRGGVEVRSTCGRGGVSGGDDCGWVLEEAPQLEVGSANWQWR